VEIRANLKGGRVKAARKKDRPEPYKRKTRDHRRTRNIPATIQMGNTSIVRDMHLLDILPWFINEYTSSMGRLIARPWSSISKFNHSAVDDLLETIYDMYSKLSLPAFLWYLGIELSFTSLSVLADQLRATSHCCTEIGMRLLQIEGNHACAYFKCLNFAKENAETKDVKGKRNLDDLEPGWEIELRNVNFTYRNNPDSTTTTPSEKTNEYVLQDFNFTFEKGKTYSIVGPNVVASTCFEESDLIEKAT